MYKLTAAKAFKDNYIWVLANLGNNAVIIDPGDSNAIIRHIKKHNYKPKAILLTHNHTDHIGGVDTLQNLFPFISVYGPLEVAKQLPNIAIKPVNNTMIINEIGLSFQVLPTPGHTLGHVSYYAKPYLFCGDVLFSAGCGRVFEGTINQMFNSLDLIANLDNKTLICSAHEYTLGNLKFAHHILPDDYQIKRRLEEIKALRMREEMTLPTRLSLEKKINLFLRCHDKTLKEKFKIDQPDLLFAELRKRKDNF